MRKLVSIQRVAAIHPIENADAIELAQIEGWQAVVKKGSFKEGDLGVYFEIDSVLPRRAEWGFLFKESAPEDAKHRIKTMKLRGCLSQGLLLPVSSLPEVSHLGEADLDTDVTELLGVTKYEPNMPGITRGTIAGNFPHIVPKTDETRIQSKLRLLKELEGMPYVITLKCDGSSSTFVMYDEQFRACSRNFMISPSDENNFRELPKDENVFWKIARKYNLPEVIAANPTLALQGEVVGPGIQKNRMGLKDHELRAFNLYDTSTGRYLGIEALVEFCNKYEIPHVPIVEQGDNFNHTLESLLKLAEGTYEGTKNPREGIVVRPHVPFYSHTLQSSFSFKVINNTFLLKGGD